MIRLLPWPASMEAAVCHMSLYSNFLSELICSRLSESKFTRGFMYGCSDWHGTHLQSLLESAQRMCQARVEKLHRIYVVKLTHNFKSYSVRFPNNFKCYSSNLLPVYLTTLFLHSALPG